MSLGVNRAGTFQDLGFGQEQAGLQEKSLKKEKHSDKLNK